MGRHLPNGTDDTVDLPNLTSPVFVHTDLMWCLDDSRNFGHAAERTLDALRQYDAFIVPTFTYSWRLGGMDFTKDTPSEIGLFSEYSRQWLPYRTDHPVFSISSNKQWDVGPAAFGQRSIFEQLHRNDGTILFLGCGFQQCTFVHYIEQCFGVDYRYYRTYAGLVNGRRRVVSGYVRNTDRGVVTKLDLAEEYMLKQGTLKREGRLMYGSSSAIFDDITRLLSYDKYYLVRFEK